MGEPPLRARLHRYKLTAAEFALLTAMCEHHSKGSTIWASIRRLAAYSKLSERSVQYLIRRLCARGILTELAPPNGRSKRKPATYQINEYALEEDPRMVPFLNCQEQLPGIRRPAVPGEAISDNPTGATNCTGANLTPHGCNHCAPTDATIAPDRCNHCTRF